MKRNPIILLLITVFTCCTSILSAQKSTAYTSLAHERQKAVELFENKQYAASQHYFKKITQELSGTNSQLAIEAEYYMALCAIELFNKDAEFLINRFIDNYPESPYIKLLNFGIGKFHFRDENYSEAIKWLSKVDKNRLPKDELPDYYFKTGYSYFNLKKYDKAKQAFDKIKDTDNPYKKPALYYYSHIAYLNKEYNTAIKGFKSLSGDKMFGEVVPYYITHIYYLQKDYKKVIDYAPPLLEKGNARRIPEIARLIGDSYYRQKIYSKAYPYLKTFAEKSKANSRENSYQLGFCYYQIRNCNEAVKYFVQVTTTEDQLAQNAYYHLGDCHIKLDQKDKARMAFSAASKLSFDKEIERNALLNYAKLTYELSYSPFNQTIKSFNEYIEKYPNSPNIDEAYNYLGKFYMSTKNYKDAFMYLDKIQDKSRDNKKAYQRVAFFRGIELFNNLEFQKAISFFDKSLIYSSFDAKIKAQTMYWKAEALYRTEKYRQAIDLYNKFLISPGAYSLPQYNTAQYNLAYSYFSVKNYPQASLWFKKYLNNTGEKYTDKAADASIRIGDCYYVKRNYQDAIRYYNSAVAKDAADADYAVFQIGFCLGLLRNYQKKAEVLQNLINKYPNSLYTDDALYELAKSHVEMTNLSQAITNYQTLIENHPNSSYVRKARMDLGLIYYNNGNNEKALATYEKIIEETPNSEQAKSAVDVFKQIYIEEKGVDAYIDYSKKFGELGNMSLTEQDSLMYVEAEDTYMEGDCEKAKQQFGNYIQKFKNGIYLLNAHFYKANCHYKAGETKKALESYNFILQKAQNMFTEPTLVKAGELNVKQKNYAAAVQNYTQLDNVAELPGNVLNARYGLMEANYKLENYNAAIVAAKKLLNTEKVSEETRRKAQYYIGKSYFMDKNYAKAEEAFKNIADNTKSEEGAEAQYRIAQINYLQNNKEKAEKICMDFIQSKTPHLYWLAKGVILLGDIYVDREDYFQAKATYKSILDNYQTPDDGIIKTVEKKMQIIRDIEKAKEKGEPVEDIEIHFEEGEE